MKYGFIGFGNLANSISKGLLKSNSIDKMAYVSKTNKHSQIQACKNLQELVSFADIILICVKPIDLETVLLQLKESDLSQKLIVSTVAAKDSNYIRNILGSKTQIVRIMPNLAIAYELSVTALATDVQDSALLDRLKVDLKKLGALVEIPEDSLHRFTALFGSGPAFLLKFLQIFDLASKAMQLSEQERFQMINLLCMGTLAFWEHNRDTSSTEDLINRVASKKGVTEAGLCKWNQSKLDTLLLDVLKAAENRSEKM